MELDKVDWLVNIYDTILEWFLVVVQPSDSFCWFKYIGTAQRTVSEEANLKDQIAVWGQMLHHLF